MTDRAVELAAALMLCAKDGSGASVACERLINRWMEQDRERAQVAQPDLVARLRNPTVQSYSDNKDNMSEAADELIATRKACNAMAERLDTALDQLGIVTARLCAAEQAVRDCLPQMGYSNLTDAELEWERKQGNQQVPAIQRARAVLADHADAKVAETPKPAGPAHPRCETCQHWDNSATLDHKENTGMCRGALPERDKRTGEAVWPFSEDTDSCPSHKPPDSGLPY